MKKSTILLVVTLIFLSACSARQQHIFALSNSMTGSKTAYHLNRIHEIDGSYKDRASKSFDHGMGGFTRSYR